jgi:hypothetical protein
MKDNRIKINPGDLALLNKKLNKLKKFSKQEFSNELGRTASDIASVAVREVVVDTGNLKQNIIWGASKFNAHVEANAVYAPFVEFGTGGLVNTNDAEKLGIDPAMIKAMFKGKGVKKIKLKPRPFFSQRFVLDSMNF